MTSTTVKSPLPSSTPSNNGGGATSTGGGDVKGSLRGQDLSTQTDTLTPKEARSRWA